MRQALSVMLMAWCCMVLFTRPSTADEGLVDRDFAEFLLGADLVVDGTLVSAGVVPHHSISGCGMQMSPIEATDMRVRVAKVVFGTAEDSTIVVSTLGRSQFPNSALQPGAHVIAWGARVCTDSWRLWGNAVVVTASDQIIGDYNSEGLFLHGQRRDRPMQYPELMTSLTMLRPRHSSQAFTGTQAVAIVRVRELQRISRGHYAYLCDSLGWVMGAAQFAPHRIEVNARFFADRYARVGDSLLVPVPQVPTDQIILLGDSSALVIRDGFAPGLGVPLSFLPYALKAGNAGFEVRPFISRE
jgi:hypothetical protein